LIALAYFAFFVTALILSIGSTWYVRNLALRFGWVRHGDRSRQVHSTVIPRLGGVGLFIGFNISLLLLVAGYHLIGRNPIYFTSVISQLWPPALLIFLVGLLDDIFDARAWVKFFAQGSAALLLFSAGLRVNPQVFGGHPLSTAMSLALTVLWVVGITNAFNLIDGLDGLAAGSALFSTVAVFMVALVAGNRTVALITIGLSGAILGFLRFNFNPATIFLGDSGSLFVGFMLSAISLASSQKSPTLVAVAIPVVACGLPILDTSIAVVRRFLSGKPIFGADREHIHHKLLNRGLTQMQAVIVLYAISALCAFMSLFLLYPGAGSGGVVLAVLGVGGWLGLKQLNYREIAELKRLARRAVDQRRIITNNLAIQYAVEHLPLATSMAEVNRLLEGMFESNDFDSFDLIIADEHHGWRKSNQGSANSWSIGINLVSTEGIAQGQLTIYREHCERPLLVDINLITTDLPLVLSNTLARLKESELANSVGVLEKSSSLQMKAKAATAG
jgi:UDP-GlcNAc:undecaprenyl-phosphate GlcNAc-1-phosphate transferase